MEDDMRTPLNPTQYRAGETFEFQKRVPARTAYEILTALRAERDRAWDLTRIFEQQAETARQAGNVEQFEPAYAEMTRYRRAWARLEDLVLYAIGARTGEEYQA